MAITTDFLHRRLVFKYGGFEQNYRQISPNPSCELSKFRALYAGDVHINISCCFNILVYAPKMFCCYSFKFLSRIRLFTVSYLYVASFYFIRRIKFDIYYLMIILFCRKCYSRMYHRYRPPHYVGFPCYNNFLSYEPLKKFKRKKLDTNYHVVHD